MKHTTHLALLPACALALSFAPSPVHAGSALFQDPVSPAGGIGYEWTVVLGAVDTVDFARTVGAWSWEDDSLSTPTLPQGWTHASDFVAVTLTQPQRLTIRVERFATPLAGGGTASIANMNPSFTIWTGWDNDGGESHMYNNDRNISWAEDISYLGHLKNNTLPIAEAFWDLPAGNYTIAVGSDAPSIDGDAQGYKATLTTSVPEPASAAFLLAGATALGLRRGRRPVTSR